MSKRGEKYRIPSPWFVRLFATFLLAVDMGIIVVVLTNFSTFEWLGVIVLLAAIVSSYFPVMALKTGDPEWVLLDLILPF
jgi:hypothetical protein